MRDLWMRETSPSRRWLVWLLRVVVLLLVGGTVWGTFRNALDELSQYDYVIRPTWLLIAGVLYVMGLVPMAWFWHRTLLSLDQPAPWRAVVRAYFLGHLGKYVPGKAMAVILRVAVVRRWVKSLRIAIASTLLETLTMMSVGALLAAVLGAWVLPSEPYLAAITGALAVAMGLPTMPPIARRLARIGAARMQQEERERAASTSEDVDALFRRLDYRLAATGWGAACACWLLLGYSLWASLRATGVDVEALADLPRLIATVAFAVVAGFASMLPGGLVVRDALLMQWLAPLCGAAGALVAAVVMRLVWLVSELAVCVILYIDAKLR